MAGPLGEMFDHGKKHPVDNYSFPAYFFILGCDALNTTVRNSRFLVSDPSVHGHLSSK